MDVSAILHRQNQPALCLTSSSNLTLPAPLGECSDGPDGWGGVGMNKKQDTRASSVCHSSGARE